MFPTFDASSREAYTLTRLIATYSELKDRMPAGRRKTIEQASDQEIRALLIAGTLICLLIVVVSFFVTHHPEWFLWIGRCFALAWVASAWYRGLRELRKRHRRK